MYGYKHIDIDTMCNEYFHNAWGLWIEFKICMLLDRGCCNVGIFCWKIVGDAISCPLLEKQLYFLYTSKMIGINFMVFAIYLSWMKWRIIDNYCCQLNALYNLMSKEVKKWFYDFMKPSLTTFSQKFFCKLNYFRKYKSVTFFLFQW